MLIFVYGTLKQGFPNFGVNQGARVPGSYRTVESLPLVLVSERQTPWLLWQPGQGLKVTGQLFEVDDATLVAMDELEGVNDPDGYLRRELLVQEVGDPERPPIASQAYLKLPAQLRGQQIQSGPHAEYTQDMSLLYRRRTPARG